jgi:hypothetical protein
MWGGTIALSYVGSRGILDDWAVRVKEARLLAKHSPSDA